MALSAGRIAQIKSMYTTYQNSKRIGYAEDDVNYGPIAVDGTWIFMCNDTIGYWPAPSFRSSADGANTGRTGTVTFTGGLSGAVGQWALSSLYKERKVLALGLNHDYYAYWDWALPASTLNALPFTGLSSFKSLLPAGVLGDVYNWFIIQGLQDGFWVLTKVSGGGTTADGIPGYGRGFLLSNDFSNAQMRLVKLRYTDLSVIRTVDFTMPANSTSLGGSEDGGVGGWEGEDYILVQHNDYMRLIDITNGTAGSVVDTWPVSSMGNLLQNGANQPIALDYGNKWVYKDRGDDGFGDPVGMTQLHTLVLDPNRPPNAPTNLNPASASIGSPVMVSTLQPTLSWVFSDIDTIDNQTAYEIEVALASNLSDIKWASGKVVSGSTSTTVPAALLVPDTTYAWRMRVWDSKNEVSPWTNGSTWGYFKTTKAPDVTIKSPLGSQASPIGVNLTPRLEWNYSDFEGHAQKSYFLQIFKETLSEKIHDTGVVTSTDKFYDVPPGVLEPGVKYQWHVRAYDTTNMSTLTGKGWFLTNNPPGKMNILSPINNIRTVVRPSFEFSIPDDVENDSMSFEVQWADDIGFTQNVASSTSLAFPDNWVVKTSSGSYAPIGATGRVNSSYEGGVAKYTKANPFTLNKTYYYRARAIDGSTGSVGQWSDPRAVRIGNILQVNLKSPMVTSTYAERIVLHLIHSMAQDGTVPATIKIEVTNNGLDTNPTWEDITNHYFNDGGYYLFNNKVRTASNFAVDIRITITANDTLGPIEIKGFGISFD